MGFSLNKFLSTLFGNKAARDIKEIRPIVEQVLAVEPEIQKLSNDELRAKVDEIKAQLQDKVKGKRAEIAELKEQIQKTEIDKRQPIFEAIDKKEVEVLDLFEEGLTEVLPTVYAIVKDTARRFAEAENGDIIVTATDFDRDLSIEHDFVDIDGDKAIWHNHWVAGGNEMTWNMIHYNVQLFGGIVLHQGKIAEMATGEGKTLVATLPVFLNALSRNGVHVVTVNDYLAKRDSEWMGPLYMFHGLSVDCIDKHQPNSEERRRAYQADITFGTNNEFGFDYLRDNMASCSASTTMPLSMRWTLCSLTMHVPHSSSLVLFRRAMCRCSRSTAPSWNSSSKHSVVWRRTTCQKPRNSLSRTTRMM